MSHPDPKHDRENEYPSDDFAPSKHQGLVKRPTLGRKGKGSYKMLGSKKAWLKALKNKMK